MERGHPWPSRKRCVCFLPCVTTSGTQLVAALLAGALAEGSSADAARSGLSVPAGGSWKQGSDRGW